MELATSHKFLSLKDPHGLLESILHIFQVQVSSVKLQELARILRGEIFSIVKDEDERISL
jgi:hypothetical protein